MLILAGFESYLSPPNSPSTIVDTVNLCSQRAWGFEDLDLDRGALEISPAD